jgi:hypothetical protein
VPSYHLAEVVLRQGQHLRGWLGDYLLGSLNNREWALVFWVLILAVFLVAYQPTRLQFPQVLRQLLWSPIGVCLLAMTVYMSLLLLVAYRVEVWGLSLLKDTLLWYFGVAALMFFSVHEATKVGRTFRRLVLKAYNSLLF